MIRAAEIQEWGAPPVAVRRPPPERAPGTTRVRVILAALNPVDLAIGSGRFYMPIPDPPFVPGAEMVGDVVESDALAPGTRVWGLLMTGAFAEEVVAADDRLVAVPDGLADDLAATAGIAGLAGWMSVMARGRLEAGERLLVLGGGGLVGQVAVQAGRAAGASELVAVCRSDAGRAAAEGRGARVVDGGASDLAAAVREALPDGADVVVDTLWGPAAPAALAALRPGGRLVQTGNAWAPVAEMPAGPMRGGRLDIRGFSVFSETPASLARGYAELAAAMGTGAVHAATEVVPLDEVAAAWARQAAGTGGVKLLLRP